MRRSLYVTNKCLDLTNYKNKYMMLDGGGQP